MRSTSTSSGRCPGALGAGPVALTPFAWIPREHGRPTAENLVRFIAIYNTSFEPGGANAHVGLRIVRAELRVNERGGKVVATGTRHTFD